MSRRHTSTAAGIIPLAMLCAALAACGSSSNSSSSSSGKTPSGTINITTWSNPTTVPVLTKIGDEFHQKYPSITVKIQTAAGITTGYATLLKTAVSTHNADIVTTPTQLQPLPQKPTIANMTPTQLYSTNGLFESLTNQSWIKNLTSDARQIETYKGQVYGVLTGSYQTMVYYNKATFAKYHLSVPTTYTEFMNVLRTLKAHNVTPIWFGAGGNGADYVTKFIMDPLMADLWSPTVQGQTLATALEKGTVSWNSPQFIKAMQEEVAISKYFEPAYTGNTWRATPGAFAANKAAMIFGGSFSLTAIHQANPSLDVGSFPLPGSDTASQNQPMAAPDLTMSVLKNAPNKAAALLFLQYFTSPAVYAEYVSGTGISPSEDGQFSSYSSQVLGDYFGKGVNPADVLPLLTADMGFNATATQWPLLQEAVIAGSKTPQEAAALVVGDFKTS